MFTDGGYGGYQGKKEASDTKSNMDVLESSCGLERLKVKWEADAPEDRGSMEDPPQG